MTNHLKLVQRSIQEEVVTAHEEFLHSSQQGDLLGFSGIYFKRGGDVVYAFQGSCVDDPFKTLQAIDALRAKIVAQLS